jgi:hypothetical protein
MMANLKLKTETTMKSLVSGTLVAVAFYSFLAASAFAGTDTGTMHLCEPLPDSGDTYLIAFEADQTAQIRVVDDGVTILASNVYDENGLLIRSDVLRDNDELVEWRTHRSKLFAVKVGPTGHSVLLTNGTCQEVDPLVAGFEVPRAQGAGL